MSLFGEVLKQLLEFSNIKMYVAAQAVGYDVSYISKWCNKDYLPGSKSSSHVNRELSRLISEDIISQNDLEEFNTCFQQQAEKKTLASVIYAMLQDAYTKSANDDKGQKKISSHVICSLLTRTAACSLLYVFRADSAIGSQHSLGRRYSNPRERRI